MTLSLYDEVGKPLRISARVGKGGEGEVYSIEGTNQVVKFYTIRDVRERELKVREMLANDLAKKCPLVAFPTSLVFDRSRRFVGFTMAKISAHQPLHELYAPGARKVAFPQANYRFLVLTAANIARAIGAANTAGCIVGDINHSGILISLKATVTLIDADSFQVSGGGKILHCLVGVPEYTPPELQGKGLSGIVRTENHDAFGLAVAIFQLLFMGRHPFGGRYSGGDMPLEKAIGEFRFAYSTVRSVGMSPPPGVPTLSDFPIAIRNAFEAAFGPSGIKNRPTPREWIPLLDELRNSLRVCSANSLHQYPPTAAECPWCRMEERFLVPLFLPTITAVDLDSAKGPIIGDILVIWGAIEAVRPPPQKVFPEYLGTAPEPTAEMRATGKRRLAKKIIGWILVAAAVGIFLYKSSAALLALIMGGVGWYLLASKTTANRELEGAYKAIQTRLYEAQAEWERHNDATDFLQLKREFRDKKEEFDALPAKQKSHLENYARNRRTLQLSQFLSKQLIRNYAIPKIGDGRRAVLLSYGIETAADIREGALLAVPGFGPKTAQPLLNWRRHLESRFVYSAAETQADKTAIATIRAETAQRAAQLKFELGMGPAKLTQLASATSSKQAANLPFIEMIQRQRAQTVANLEALGGSPPHVARPISKASAGTPPLQTPSATGTRWPPTIGPQSTRCPKCGGNMVIRLAMRGHHRGNKFYGCLRYPNCSGTRPFP
jgi:DNA-binding helix-hairpin-helix protein with protein kinase domain